MNVVELRPADNPNNIPSLLRELADDIERGDLEAKHMVVLVEREDDWPLICTYGSTSVAKAVFVLQQASSQLVNNVVRKTP